MQWTMFVEGYHYLVVKYQKIDPISEIIVFIFNDRMCGRVTVLCIIFSDICEKYQYLVEFQIRWP